MKKNEYKRIINFNFIDMKTKGRFKDLASLEICLKYEDSNKPVFSVIGDIKDGREYIACGQCLDGMYPYLKNNKLFKEIYTFWKKYHLNDLHGGTIEQEKCLIENEKEIKKRLKDYDKYKNSYYKVACEILKEHNLYEVMLDGKPYRYGEKWLYYEIPEKDLNRIKEIITNGC